MGYLLTRESARKAGACYDDKRLATLIPVEGSSPRQVAELEIPIDDRIWALCNAVGASDKTLRLFAVWCAREALKLGKEPDPRSVNACDVAEAFANGDATQADLDAARAAARAAAWDAARAAARAAAWAAAGAAAWDAARAAAWAAAGAAAWDAVWAAARDAQSDIIRRYLPEFPVRT